MQSTVPHQMQPGVQPTLSQLSDRTMEFHALSKSRAYRRRLGGKYDGREKGAEKLEKADILELTVEYLKSSANHKPWVQSTNIAWTYFLAGYTSCEENLRQLVDSTVPTCSGVKMASLITTIESQKLQAVYNFLNAFNQQIGSPSQPPASSADTSEGCTRGKNVVWRPWR
nr:transcription factor HES 2 [Hymenolepis microstoma]